MNFNEAMQMLGTKLQGKYGHLGFKYKKSDKTLTRHSKNFAYMIAFSSFGGNTKDSISIEVCYIQKQKALTLAGQDAERIQALTEYRPEVISRLIDKVRVFEGGRIEIGLKSKYLTDIIGECIPGLAS